MNRSEFIVVVFACLLSYALLKPSLIMSTPKDMITQLEKVRQACLADAVQYISVVPGVVPVLQGAQAVIVRRWGADFMAEAFATPELRDHQKEQMLSDSVLALLRSMLDNPGEDVAVVKSTVQASASIYPHIFRKMYVVLVQITLHFLILLQNCSS